MEKYTKTWRPTHTRTPKSGYLKISIAFAIFPGIPIPS